MKRERYIDLTKGLGILCIVFLHFEDGLLNPHVNVFIGSFMITLFYVTAGWIDAQRTTELTVRQLIRRRWQQLGIPYLWWSAIIMAFDCILWAAGYYDTYFIAREAYKTIVLRGIGTLWFLPALFGGELIWRLIKRRWWLIAVCLMLTLAYHHVYSSYFSVHTSQIDNIIRAPFYTIDNMLMAWVGLSAGYAFFKVLSHFDFSGWSAAVTASAGITLGIIAYLCAVYLSIGFLWPIFAPLIGPLAFILIFKSIQGVSVTNYLDYWGRNSLCLMVTHYSIVMIFCDIANRAIFGQENMHGWYAILWFAVCMAVEYPINILIDKYLPYTLGRKKA